MKNKEEKKVKPFEITILTRPPLTFLSTFPFLVIALKQLVKRVLFFLTRRPRFLFFGGPEAVARSLKTGLREIGVNFKFNPWKRGVSEVVGVIGGVNTLRWSLKQKETKKIKTLLAGPNIVNAPPDEGKLIKDPLIDKIVVPSKWNKDWWISYDQYLEPKIVPWPAGVKDKGVLRNPQGVCLLYVKNLSFEVYEPIIRRLWAKKIPIKILHYGRFLRSSYYRALSKAKFMIYLSHAESQGLALHEAWMADVPTLIWNPGFFEIGDRTWKDELMSAPYFDSSCGLLFSSKEEFPSKLDEFLIRYGEFNPRNYSLDRFTDRAAADAYMAVVKEVVGEDYESIDNHSNV